VFLNSYAFCSSAIIEDVQSSISRSSGGDQRPNLAYFYFSFDSVLGQDISSVLRSLIWQLCADRDDLSKPLALLQRKYPEKPSSSDLRTTLKAILERYGRNSETLQDSVEQRSTTYLIFDGLDELRHGAHREAVLGLIKDISKLPTYSQTHILVTSRAEKDISHQFSSMEGWLRYSMSRSKIRNDIALFVSDQISSYPKLNGLPDVTKSAIREKLVRGSKEM
jgi:hypothetical protein